MQDEATRLRATFADLDDDGPGRFPIEGEPALVVKTTTVSAYPTTASCFYACISQGVFGDEVEGGAVSLTANGDLLYAYNEGSAIPPAGTTLLIRFIDQRWVFRYDG